MQCGLLLLFLLLHVFAFYFDVAQKLIKQIKMGIGSEQLPIEIWLSIFSHLEAQELFRSFTILNSYFDQLVNCIYLKFNIQFTKTKNEYHPRLDTQFMIDLVLNRTITFELSSGKRRGKFIWFFFRCHYDRLTGLQSLSLNVSKEEVSFIPIVLE
jgi:hypothetical protein